MWFANCPSEDPHRKPSSRWSCLHIDSHTHIWKAFTREHTCTMACPNCDRHMHCDTPTLWQTHLLCDTHTCTETDTPALWHTCTMTAHCETDRNLGSDLAWFLTWFPRQLNVYRSLVSLLSFLYLFPWLWGHCLARSANILVHLILPWGSRHRERSCPNLHLL